jgi:transposase
MWQTVEMKAYPAELRTRIVAAVERGMAHPEVARVFAVSERTIRRYLAQQRHTNDLTPGRSPGRPPTIGPDHAAALSNQVAAHPDATLADHCTIWAREQGVTVSVATMSRTIRSLGITLKKNPVRG